MVLSSCKNGHVNHADLNTHKQDRNCKFGPQRHKTWKEKECLQYIFRGSDKTILYSTWLQKTGYTL